MPERDTARADRILDASAELLVQLGYRKVTIEDIAQRAAIGKGTVYLHWRTKQQLFEALFVREAVTYLQDLLAELRRDPAMVLPHRLLPASFAVVSRKPVLRTVFGGELGHMHGRLADSAVRSKELLATAQFYDLLIRHGLLRDDVPNLDYALTAVHAGFYLYDTVSPKSAMPDVEAKAVSLAHIIRHAFEPAREPDPADVTQAAAELAALFAELIPPYLNWIYNAGPAGTPG